MKIVIALGGNALIKRNEKETYENLLKNIKKTCSKINNIIKNNKTVITFGNGPEVGNLLLENEIIIKKDSNRGYRRVVPSPKPIRIIESNIINELVNKNYIVIAAGGGGVPVVLKNKKLIGVECVVDKDLSSSVLGKEIRADLLLILTDVDRVYLNYGKQNKKALRRLSVEEAKKYLREGQFPGGSMGPKIEAAINFLEIGGKRVIITSIENAEKALNGKAGTLIKK